MPLHLLPKKSWNVYNADNIAKVKADVAAAAAREADEKRRQEEYEAECRTAKLRGRTPPPPPEPLTYEDDRRGRGRDDRGREDRRKRRRLPGEDDTDRDIRLARDSTAYGADSRTLKLRELKGDAALTDHAGHINLFPEYGKKAIQEDSDSILTEEEKKRIHKASRLEAMDPLRVMKAGAAAVDRITLAKREREKQVEDLRRQQEKEERRERHRRHHHRSQDHHHRSSHHHHHRSSEHRRRSRSPERDASKSRHRERRDHRGRSPDRRRERYSE